MMSTLNLSQPLMTALEVRTQTIHDADFDLSLVGTVLVLDAQRRYIRDAIGETLYDSLTEGVQDGNLTTDENTLLETWVKPCLAYYTLWTALPEIRMNVTNAGVMTNFVAHAEPADSRDFGVMRSTVRDKAENRKNELVKFLKDNSTLYPDYTRAKDKEQSPTGFVVYKTDSKVRKRRFRNLDSEFGNL